MINSSHTHNSKRTPVHCTARRHTNGSNPLLTKIGINSSGIEGIYLWCGKCREEHFLSMVNIWKALEELREGGMIEGTQATKIGDNEKRGRDNV